MPGKCLQQPAPPTEAKQRAELRLLISASPGLQVELNDEESSFAWPLGAAAMHLPHLEHLVIQVGTRRSHLDNNGEHLYQHLLSALGLAS